MPDDLWDALVDLFGEVGIWFVPGGVLLAAVVIELVYHFTHGGWIG